MRHDGQVPPVRASNLVVRGQEWLPVAVLCPRVYPLGVLSSFGVCVCLGVWWIVAIWCVGCSCSDFAIAHIVNLCVWCFPVFSACWNQYIVIDGDGKWLPSPMMPSILNRTDQNGNVNQESRAFSGMCFGRRLTYHNIHTSKTLA